MDRIGIDIVGPCPITENGNQYIIVVGDYFSKWKEAYPVPNHTAQTVADKLMIEFISRFGTPRQIHSDQGREFESELFKVLCEKLGIEKTRTSPYRPNSDGLIERFNRTLKQMLTNFVNQHRNDWDDHIPYVLMAYRATVHESTGCTPNLLMFGHEICLPLDLMVGSPSDRVQLPCRVEYLAWLENSILKSCEFTRQNLANSARRQKHYYDWKLKIRPFEQGQFVWRWYPPTANVTFGRGWTGPYKVLTKVNDVNYQIQKTPQHKPIVVHADHLKSYEGQDIPADWVTVREQTAQTAQEPHTVQENSAVSEFPGEREKVSSGEMVHENETNLKVKTTDTSCEQEKRSSWGRPIRPPLKYSS